MEPIINIEENIGKTVGRRNPPTDSFSYAMTLQKTANELQKSIGHGGLFPRGVFRFKTHEEADAWILKALIKRATK